MSTGTGDFIKRLRALSYVRRWNFHPITREQNVAEHSFYVAVYASMLAEMQGYLEMDVYKVMRCALLHDFEESITGDLPSLVKHAFKESWSSVEKEGIKQLFSPLAEGHPIAHWEHEKERLNSGLRMIVKAADVLDRVMYCLEEKSRGNTNYDRILDESIKQLRDMKIMSVNHILNELELMQKGVDLPEIMTHL